MEEALIRVKDLCKIYNPGENEVRALDHINLEINKGEFVAIIGQSGSGKSTFMNMLGCLDVPTSGEYFLNGPMCPQWKIMNSQKSETGRSDLFFRDLI